MNVSTDDGRETNAGRILEDGETPPTSEAFSLAGYMKARPSRTRKIWKQFDPNDTMSSSGSYYDSVLAQDDTPNDALRACIRNIPPDKDLDNTKLRYGLSQTCDVTYVDIHKRKGFAFISFKTLAALKAAIAANPHFIGGHELYVEERYQPDDETRTKREMQRQQIDFSATPNDPSFPELFTRGAHSHERLSTASQRMREPENTIMCRCESNGDLSVFHWSRSLGNFYLVGSIEATLAEQYQQWVKFLLAHPRFRDENHVLKKRALGNTIAQMVKMLNGPDRHLYADPFRTSTTLLGSEHLLAQTALNNQPAGLPSTPTGKAQAQHRSFNLQSMMNQAKNQIQSENLAVSSAESQGYEWKSVVPKRTLDRTLQWQKRLEEAKLVEQATEDRRRMRALYLEARKMDNNYKANWNNGQAIQKMWPASGNIAPQNQYDPGYISKSHVAQMAAHLDPGLARDVRRTVLYDPFQENRYSRGQTESKSQYVDQEEAPLESKTPPTFQKTVQRPKPAETMPLANEHVSTDSTSTCREARSILNAVYETNVKHEQFDKGASAVQPGTLDSPFHQKNVPIQKEMSYEEELEEWWTSGIRENAKLDRWSDACLAGIGIDQSRDPMMYRDAEIAVKLMVPLICMMSSYNKHGLGASHATTNYTESPKSAIDATLAPNPAKALFENDWEPASAVHREHEPNSILPGGGVSLYGWNGPGPIA